MREIAVGRSWDLDRLMHRQTYIDLIRAYLVDYGPSATWRALSAFPRPMPLTCSSRCD